VEEQSQNISVTSKRVISMEDTLRFKESEIDKKESVLRRMTESAAETKKKLMQAEVKIRQLTQATVKDLKQKVKEKQNEINVLKEMIKSSSSSLKAKDIDIQRLNKRVQRLEKLVEINKNFDGAQGRGSHQDVIPERNEIMEDTQNFGIPSLSNMNGFQEGLETQVNQELLQH
jgi:chromosome segregation ATPase